MTEKKTSFLDAIKAAQSVKSKVPAAKAKLIQQEKLQKQKPGSNRPTKRAAGRGG
jgi:hypothetical protein